MEQNDNGTLRYPGADYFYVDVIIRHVEMTEDCGTMIDDSRFNQGNYFHTRGEAEAHLGKVAY